MSDAMLETLHDIPKRVPSRDRSGVMFANAADGTVTRAAEKKPTELSISTFLHSKIVDGERNLPHKIENAMNVLSFSILIQDSDSMPLENAHKIQVVIAPT